jgi:starvation-inducible DNA-binding protein
MTATQSAPVLQAALVDLLDLGLQGKQAHWNVQGPNFRSVHLQLDELVEQLIAWQDEVAERISAIGGSPDGRAATVAQTSQVPPLPAGPLPDAAVVQAFAERLDAVARRLEASFTAVEDDLPSQDVLIGTVAGLDKAAWFFRAQLA